LFDRDRVQLPFVCRESARTALALLARVRICIVWRSRACRDCIHTLSRSQPQRRLFRVHPLTRPPTLHKPHALTPLMCHAVRWEEQGVCMRKRGAVNAYTACVLSEQINAHDWGRHPKPRGAGSHCQAPLLLSNVALPVWSLQCGRGSSRAHCEAVCGPPRPSRARVRMSRRSACLQMLLRGLPCALPGRRAALPYRGGEAPTAQAHSAGLCAGRAPVETASKNLSRSQRCCGVLIYPPSPADAPCTRPSRPQAQSSRR
jgi:hypothetical protein